ncbi:hypothetical protein CBS101457_004165 [Exobasidium rhododendri]|nr:hypothetical protein CBS101457_004165 [Exobasidium rhododendri]
MSSAGESRRRAEIEAKRAKLAELKKAREERTSRLQVGKTDGKTVSEVSQLEGRVKDGSLQEIAEKELLDAFLQATTPSSRKDLDDFVATLVGNSRGGSSSAGARFGVDGFASPSSPKKASIGPTTSEFSEPDGGPSAIAFANRSDGEEQGHAVVRGKLVDSEVQTEVVETPKKELVYYTKEVQTTMAEELSDREEGASGSYSGQVSASAEEIIRSRILKEQELERLQQEEEIIRRQEQILELEIEEELRELTSTELSAIFGAPEFTDFVEHSSKIVERALTDSYDYMKDYTLLDDRAADDYEGRQVKCQRTFWDEKLCRGRSVTDIGWSTKHPELVVVSYSRSETAATDEPDGLVLVWNIHLADRPEFVFHAQTDVLSTCFSPFHPNLVIGGTYSGQILVWDTRARSLPILKTPLSAAGHTHPVYSIQMIGTQNAHNLMTASTDGTVCSWMLDMLARPQETLELLNSSHPKTDEVSVTVLGFPDQETTNFWVGTEEGNIYQAARYDRAGFKAGLNTSEVYRGHAAPITGLHFHPLHGSVDFSELFLSSSMDWTSRLWRLKGNSTTAAAATTASAAATIRSGGNTTQRGESIAPILTLEEANDYVYDVAWHTVHPALFAQVDGSGRFDLFNLNIDAERPIVSITVGSARALNKIKWDKKDGKRAATGGADGRVYVYDIGGMATPREEEWIEFQKVIARLMMSSSNNNNAALSSQAFSTALVNNNLVGSTASADSITSTPHRATVDLNRISQRLSVR